MLLLLLQDWRQFQPAHNPAQRAHVLKELVHTWPFVSRLTIRALQSDHPSWGGSLSVLTHHLHARADQSRRPGRGPWRPELQGLLLEASLQLQVALCRVGRLGADTLLQWLAGGVEWGSFWGANRDEWSTQVAVVCLGRVAQLWVGGATP